MNQWPLGNAVTVELYGIFQAICKHDFMNGTIEVSLLARLFQSFQNNIRRFIRIECTKRWSSMKPPVILPEKISIHPAAVHIVRLKELYPFNCSTAMLDKFTANRPASGQNRKIMLLDM